MSDRAARVEALLEEAGVDALLVTSPVNLRYLTGFTGSNGLCVIGAGLRRFVTDFRYVERAAGEIDGFEIERSPTEFLAALRDGWPEDGLRLGFEDHVMTVRAHARVAALLPDGVQLAPAGGLVERQRAIKEPAELERIAAAAALADDALGEVLEGGLAGRRERDVARDLEAAIRRRGGEPAFSTIVASGERGALPHATPGDDAIEPGTLVTIDWGVLLDGYCSDCTRTYAAGDPAPELRELYALVQRAQAAALEAVAPGPLGRDVDAVARELIREAGHGEDFGHGLGHGVGLEVHEAPRLGTTGTDPLRAGNVVTVEPGVYVQGTGGVRIEDLVAVTAAGHRVLSGISKDLTDVG
jgi:Xaa-Pro aminopeptidase